MSRIGKQPIEIPAGVTITVGDSEITVAGPKGSLIVPVQPKTKVAIDGNTIRKAARCQRTAVVEPTTSGL